MAAASPCTSEFVTPRQNESESERLGIVGKHPPPYHLQTCGKIERFHQTQKRWAREATTPGSLAELGAHLDRFRLLYNQHRPHRAIGRRTPQAVFGAKVKAGPGSARGPSTTESAHVDRDGRVTLRYASRLHHIGPRPPTLRHADRAVHRGPRRPDRDRDGELLRQLVLDPTRDYQRQSA
jgi:hypothetical protein